MRRFAPSFLRASTAGYQLVTGQYGVLVSLLKGEIATTPLAAVISKRKALDTQLLKMAQILAM